MLNILETIFDFLDFFHLATKKIEQISTLSVLESDAFVSNTKTELPILIESTHYLDDSQNIIKNKIKKIKLKH